jgi:hypothetical protein
MRVGEKSGDFGIESSVHGPWDVTREAVVNHGPMNGPQGGMPL